MKNIRNESRRSGVRNVADALAEVAITFIGSLDAGFGSFPGIAVENGVPGWRPVGRFSVRTTEWVVRFLPSAHRSLYREIYHSELAELAQGLHPRRAQAAYTIRLLLHVLPLRLALRAPDVNNVPDDGRSRCGSARVGSRPLPS